MKLLVLNSGGYDSTVCLEWALKNNHSATSLFFDYNQHTLEVESKFSHFNATIRDIEHMYVRVPLSWGLPKPDGVNQYVPLRNLIFFSNALSIAEAGEFDGIVAGIIKCPAGQYYKDTSPKFINWFRKMCEDVGIKFITPLSHMSKEDVYKFGRGVGIDPIDTWSCDSAEKLYGYNFKRCGKCNDCKHLKSAIDEKIFTTPVEFCE